MRFSTNLKDYNEVRCVNNVHICLVNKTNRTIIINCYLIQITSVSETSGCCARIKLIHFSIFFGGQFFKLFFILKHWEK